MSNFTTASFALITHLKGVTMQRYVCQYNKSAQRLRNAAAIEAFNALEPNEARQVEQVMHKIGQELGLGPQSTFELITCLGIYLANKENPGKSDRRSQAQLPRRELRYEFFPG